MKHTPLAPISLTHSVLAMALLGALTACSTPPQAPTVDDSNKRPLNDPNVIALQSCKSELSASRSVLTEVLAKQPLMPARVTAHRETDDRGNGSSAGAPAAAASAAAAGAAQTASSAPATSATTTLAPQSPPAQLTAIRPNTVFIVHFDLGSSDFSMSADQRDELIRLARDAKYVVVRGRTDAKTDTPLQTNLAKRRASAAFDYLTTTVRVPAEAIRVTWQGAGDSLVAGDAPAQRLANRRVELEFYATAPQVDVVAR